MPTSTSRKPSLRSVAGIWHLYIGWHPQAGRPLPRGMIRPQGSYVGSEYGMGCLAQSLSLHHFHPVPGKAGARSFLGNSSSHEELILGIMIQTAQVELGATCHCVLDTVSKAVSRSLIISEFTSSGREADFLGQLDNPCLAWLTLEPCLQREGGHLSHILRKRSPGSGTQMVVSCDEPTSGGTHLPEVTL